MKKTLLFTLIAVLLTGNVMGQEKAETQKIKALEKKVDSLTELNRQIYVKAQQFDKVLEIQKKEANADQKDFMADVKQENATIKFLAWVVSGASIGGVVLFLFNHFFRFRQLAKRQAEIAVERARSQIEQQIKDEIGQMLEQAKAEMDDTARQNQETFDQMLKEASLEYDLKQEAVVYLYGEEPNKSLKKALGKMGFRTENIHLLSSTDQLKVLGECDLFVIAFLQEDQIPEARIYEAIQAYQEHNPNSSTSYFYFGKKRFEDRAQMEAYNLGFANSRSAIHARLVELLTARQYFS